MTAQPDRERHRITLKPDADTVAAECSCGWQSGWPVVDFGTLSRTLTDHANGVGDGHRTRLRIPNKVARRALPSGLAYWKTKADRYYAGCTLCGWLATEVPAGDIAAWWADHFESSGHQTRAESKRVESDFFATLEKTITS